MRHAMDADLWQPLDGGGSRAELVGGKAAGIDCLVAIGMRVAPAAALTVDAYRAFVAGSELRDFVSALAAEVEPDRIAEESDRVRRAFAEAPLPSEVTDAIHAAYAAVGEGVVAVRSSATSEDMAGSSFAGQYDTVLNVDGDDLEGAVRQCWASLWMPGVRAYREAQDIEDRELAMGVVIQRMVDAKHSGVAFSVDP